jgi:hypothetical protein
VIVDILLHRKAAYPANSAREFYPTFKLMPELPWGEFFLTCAVVDRMLLPTPNVAEIGQSILPRSLIKLKLERKI